MEPDRGIRTTNGVAGATTALLFTAGLALAGWISIWAIYAWAMRDASWVLGYGGTTVLALGLPVAFVRGYERWQVAHGLYAPAPGRGTKILSSACGLLATLLGLMAAPFVVLFGYVAWGFWRDGAVAVSVYFAVVALAMLAEPLAFLVYYDRWRTRNGLQ